MNIESKNRERAVEDYRSPRRWRDEWRTSGHRCRIFSGGRRDACPTFKRACRRASFTAFIFANHHLCER